MGRIRSTHQAGAALAIGRVFVGLVLLLHRHYDVVVQALRTRTNNLTDTATIYINVK